LALADVLPKGSHEARDHAERAAQLLGTDNPADRLRAATRLWGSGLLVDLVVLDSIARSTTVAPDARLEWWGVRAERCLETEPERGAGVLTELEILATERAPCLVRGRALTAGVALALALADTDVARRFSAGASEAALCVGHQVVVVGGGNSAAQATLHFSQHVAHATLVVRGDSLKSTVSAYLVDRISAAKNVEVLTQTEVTALEGSDMLQAVLLTNRQTGASRRIETHWVFVCIGGAPRTEWAVQAGVTRDEAGYLVTGPDLLRDDQRPDGWALDRPPYYLETNIPGLFAAGDVRHGSVKRCASAVGEGAMAVMFVHRYLAGG